MPSAFVVPRRIEWSKSSGSTYVFNGLTAKGYCSVRGRGPPCSSMFLKTTYHSPITIYLSLRRRSIEPQRRRRNDACRSSSGQPRCANCGQRHEYQTARIGQRIKWVDEQEFRAQYLRHSERECSPHNHACRGDSDRLVQDEPDDRTPRGTQGHSNSDFPCPLRHQVNSTPYTPRAHAPYACRQP